MSDMGCIPSLCSQPQQYSTKEKKNQLQVLLFRPQLKQNKQDWKIQKVGFCQKQYIQYQSLKQKFPKIPNDYKLIILKKIHKKIPQHYSYQRQQYNQPQKIKLKSDLIFIFTHQENINYVIGKYNQLNNLQTKEYMVTTEMQVLSKKKTQIRNKKNYSIKFSGIKNRGNTCYINSALQIIFHTSKIIQTYYKIKQKCISIQLGTPITFQIYQLIKQIQISEMNNLDPYFLKTAMQKKNSRFIGYNQQDSFQFLSSLIMALIEQSDQIASKKNQFQSLRSTFKGVFSLKIQCLSSCNSVFDCKNQYYQIILDLPDPQMLNHKQTNSLYDCIQKYFKPQILEDDNAWYCHSCKKDTRSKRTTKINQIPSILIFCLKRLQRQKNQCLIDFPLVLDLSKFKAYFQKQQIGQFKYNLYGVINHRGSKFGGHYTAMCKDTEGDWHSYNDSYKKKIEPGEIVQNQAYILVYQKDC